MRIFTQSVGQAIYYLFYSFNRLLSTSYSISICMKQIHLCKLNNAKFPNQYIYIFLNVYFITENIENTLKKKDFFLHKINA